MNLKASAWFVVGSLIQAGIISIGDWTGYSTFPADLKMWQLAIHIGVGQINGYILLALFRKYRNSVERFGATAFGILYGLAAWGIVLSLATAINFVKSTGWQSGTGMLTTIFAFIAYGLVASIVAGDVVKQERREEIRENNN